MKRIAVVIGSIVLVPVFIVLAPFIGLLYCIDTAARWWFEREADWRGR